MREVPTIPPEREASKEKADPRLGRGYSERNKPLILKGVTGIDIYDGNAAIGGNFF